MNRLPAKMMRPENMQEYNSYIVLELVKNNGPISRADISRYLKFSKPAVSNIISLLESYGLIEYTGEGRPATGRRSKLLSFNPKSSYFISADLRWKEKAFALVDLSGQIAYQTFATEDHQDPNLAVEFLNRHFQNLIQYAQSNKMPIEGIGIMVPAVVNPETGAIGYASDLEWNGKVDLGVELQKRTHLPVSVENDANALALGESWIGAGKIYSNLAYCFVGKGIGGAYISNGEILRGDNYAACEFGQMLLASKNGPELAEKILSIPKLVERFEPCLTIKNADYESFFNNIAGMLTHKNQIAIDITNEVIDLYAQLFANIVSTLNPEVIILNSPILNCGKAFLDALNEKTHVYLPTLPSKTVNILPAQHRKIFGVIGGAAVAIRKSRFKFIIRGNGF